MYFQYVRYVELNYLIKEMETMEHNVLKNVNQKIFQKDVNLLKNLY